MAKWFSKLFDSSEGEINRLRRIVAQVNEEIVVLLENQRENIATLRSELWDAVPDAAALNSVQGREMAAVAADARRLAGEADTLRAVIERGEETSRELTVLIADSKQLAAMNAERLQRPPAERRDLDAEIDTLIDELGEQLSALMEGRPDLREAVMQAVPKLKLPPQRPGAEEMVRAVEATANFLGREVADYYGRTNEMILALRRAVGLNTLVDLSPHASADLKRSAADLDAEAHGLVQALVERDLMKHLTRQGLRLPAEFKSAGGLGDEQAMTAQNSRGRRGRDNAQAQAPDLGEKDGLADTLFWEERATSELLGIAAACADEEKSGRG